MKDLQVENQRLRMEVNNLEKMSCHIRLMGIISNSMEEKKLGDYRNTG